MLGTAFEKDATVNFEGVNHKVVMTHYIVSVRAESTENGYTYVYTLASSYPSAYHYPEWISNPMYEDSITKKYKLKGN